MATLLPAAAHRRVPWRNGGGVTDEIIVEPHPRHPDDASRFAWRLSIAHVEVGGPFSSFPGVDRILMLLEGAGMELRVGEAAWLRVDRPFAPLDFAGEAPVECRLIDGPVRDFNVMVDRETIQVEAAVFEASGGGAFSAPASAAVHAPGSARIVVALRGGVEVRRPEGAWRLAATDALRLDEAPPLELVLESDGAVALVDFSRR